jgi:hypothetical protein
VIVTFPGLGPPANTVPLLFTVAIVLSEEVHAARLVTLRVLPLDRAPVAEHCRLVPCARDAVLGFTVTDVKVGGTTARVAVPLTAPFVAVMVTGLVVAPTPVANPLATIVALLVSDDVHVTLLVMFWVLVSLKVPVAVNCCWLPSGIEGLAGVTAIDVNVALVTVSVSGGLMTDPNVAVMAVVPAVRPLATPCVPSELLMVANPGTDDFQVTVEVITLVLLSA